MAALVTEENTSTGDDVVSDSMPLVAERLSTRFRDWFLSSNSVKILIIGKRGIGKSVLINGMIGIQAAANDKSARTRDASELSEVQTFSLNFNGVDITVWESSGLQDGIEEECIPYLQAQGCGKADLVLYCVNRKKSYHQFFTEDNNAIKKLTNGLGVDIWKKTAFIMMFANEYDRRMGSFKECQAQWKAKLAAAVVDAGVDARIAANIPVIPAGSDREQALPDRDNWLSCLWCACILRMNVQSQPALLKINLHRIELPHQISSDEKPLHKEPIIYKKPPTRSIPNIFLCLEKLVDTTNRAETDRDNWIDLETTLEDRLFLGSVASSLTKIIWPMSAVGAGGTNWLIDYYSCGCDS